LIKDAKHLPEVSYQQMQEMSQAGAKVLNAQAVQFAKNSQIAIYARSTFHPGKETVIRQLPLEIPKGVKAVVHEKEIIRVVLQSNNINEDFEWLLKFLEDKQVQIKELNLIASENDNNKSKLSFIISPNNIYELDNTKNKLTGKFGSKIEFDQNFGAVSLIGEGLNRDNSILLETINILKNNEIKIWGITTTSFRISLLVQKELLEQCIKICHKRWIEELVEFPA